MNYHWNWSVLLQQVATGENSTYLGWIAHGFVITAMLTLVAWLLALALGTFFGVMRTLPGAGRGSSA